MRLIRNNNFMFQRVLILSIFIIGFLAVTYNSDTSTPLEGENQEKSINTLAKQSSSDESEVYYDISSEINRDEGDSDVNSIESSSNDWYYKDEEGRWYDYRNGLKPYRKNAQTIKHKKTGFHDSVGDGFDTEYTVENNKLLITTTIGSFSTITYDFDEDDFHAIVVQDTELSLNYGYPTMLYKNFIFNIPENTELKSVKVHNHQLEPIYGVNLIPGPEPQFISEGSDIVTNLYFDSIAYSQRTYTPEKIVEYHTIGIDGKSGIYLTLHPMQYNPVKRSLKLYTHQTIEIEFASTVSINDFTFDQQPSFGSSYGNNNEGYVIIADQSYTSYLTEFIAWKEQLGFNVTLKTIQDIFAQYPGRDRPEQVRNYINASYNENNTKYVLLVGDCDVVPAREVVDPYNVGMGLDNGSEPSDLYFECLDGDWDADGDSLFGEMNDNVDFFPEVMVGRLPVNTPDQARSVCASIIRLESDPQPGDWMNNFLLIGPQAFVSGDSANMLEEELNQKFLYDSFFDVYRLYQTDGSASSTNTINRLNSGVGIVDFFDHGAYDQWVGALTSAQALGLNNGNMSFLAFAMACETAAFDAEGVEPTISEAFFRNSNGGAIAYIGATRIAFAGYHAFDGFHNQFWNYFLETALSQQISSPKVAFQSSLYDTVTTFDMTDSVSLETVYQAIYFGDPAMHLYWKHNVTTTATPVNINEEVDVTTKCQLYLSGDTITSDVNVTVKDPIGRIIYYNDSLITDSQGEYSIKFDTNELPGTYTVETVIATPFEYTATTEFYVGDISLFLQLDSDPIFNTNLSFSGTSNMDGTGNVSLVDNQGNILETRLFTVNGGVFSSDINISSFGPLILYIQVENGGSYGANCTTFRVIRGNVLLIADDTGTYGVNYPGGWADINIGDSTNIADFMVALKEKYNVTFYFPRYEMAPSIALLNSYDVVVVSVGDNIGSPLITPDSFLLDVLLAYHNSGGHLIFEGGSILTVLNSSGYSNYFPNLFHNTYTQRVTNSGGLYLDNDAHPITQGLPTSILLENGLGSYYADVFAPTNGSTHVSGYSGSFTGGTAISTFNPSDPLGGVIFLGFSIDAISNDADRYHLIQNMIEFLLIPSFIVDISDDALPLGTSETIMIDVRDSATGAPVSNANVSFLGCGIDTSNLTLNDGKCTIYVNPSASGLIQVEITKQDYMTYSSVIVVYDIPTIEIDTNPSFLEGDLSQNLTITTSDYYESSPVDNCLVTIDGCGVTESGYTNSSGMINFTIIPTNIGTIVVNANKTGYINTTSYIQVTNLKNYNMFEIGFTWFDAETNGYNSGIDGLDSWGVLNLPFQFYYYDTYFNTVYISSHGYLSFTDTEPNDWTPQTFPSSTDPYAIACFWDDLIAQNNIYIWETPDFVVIEYNNYFHTGGSLAGTFEIILFSDGTILFQYLSIQTDYGSTVGLNYGINTSYYTAYTDGLGGITNFALFFTMGVYESHNVAAGLESPSIVKFETNMDPILINASVLNIGTYDETDVELQLWINNTKVNTTIFPLIVNGTNATITYPWNPLIEGVYNITVYIVPVTDETFTFNNRILKFITVASGSLILFDQGHSTDSVSSYTTWINDLTSAGYFVTITTDPITTTLLEPYSVLIIPKPREFYSSTEQLAIQSFVGSGNGLFVIGDEAVICNDLTYFTGINWLYSGASGGITSDISTPHPVTAGVEYINFPSPECQLEVFDPALSLIRLDGTSEFAVSDIGFGRVAAIGDDQVAINGIYDLENNSLLLMNLIDWLNSTCLLEHDLSCYLETPEFVVFDESTLINATIINWGNNDEVNVELQLWINNDLENSTIITEIFAGASEFISYNWTPALEDTYNVTFYIVPVTDESYVINNYIERSIIVSSGSFILFDQGHSTDSVSSYTTWISELSSAGYIVVTTSDPITNTILEACSVLVIPQAHNFYSGSELSAIQSFVASGNGLFVIGDDDPAIYNDLTSFAAVNWLYGGASGGITSDVGTPHPVTNGVNSVNFPYPECHLEAHTGISPAIELIHVGGICEFVVSDIGFGRVAGIGDDEFLYDPFIVQEDNLLLIMNLINWLNDTQVLENETSCKLYVPNIIQFGNSVQINVTVTNWGIFDEIDVEIKLWINDILENSATLPLLISGTSMTTTYDWTPTFESVYNVTCYVVPVMGETYLVNNRMMKDVTVTSLRYILFDQGHGTDSISSYSTWIAELNNAGYIVDTTTNAITTTLLVPYSVLVIPQAHNFYSSSELSAIQSFVTSGNGLFVIGDDEPTIYTELTSFSGINWINGGMSGATTDITVHPVTDGVTSVYFGIPISEIVVTSPAISLVRVSGTTEFAVSDLGFGRVAGIGDEDTIQNIDINQADNLLLAMNLINWLCQAQPQDHELACSLNSPNLALPGDSVDIVFGVDNIGLEDEIDVEVQLWINNSLVNNTIFPVLLSGASERVNYSWTPILEGMYNITAYVVPVTNETKLVNNRMNSNVIVTSGSVVLFDQGHSTDPISSYSIWINEIINAGYYVMTTTDTITTTLLSSYSVLIIPNAKSPYSNDEISAIHTFVQSGNGLFVIGDYGPSIYTTLTSFSGINWLYGGVSGTATDITPHPVTDGVSSVSFSSAMCELDTTNPAISLVRLGGFTEFAVSDLGTGRVAGIGDENALWDTDIGNVDNLLLVMNLIHWLEDAQLHDHDLTSYHNCPSGVLLGDFAQINITVSNYGIKNETNVVIQLWINDSLEYSTIITSLLSGASVIIDYYWYPSDYGLYNVTTYVIPVINETSTQNNFMTQFVTVGDPIIDFKIGDYLNYYLDMGGTVVPYANFTYLYFIDSTHVYVDVEGDGISEWMSVNIITRLVEDGTFWVGGYFPCQIETDIGIGDTIYWFDELGIVEGTVFYNYNGFLYECWNISIPNQYCSAIHHKKTGIWFSLNDNAGLQIFLVNTNMIVPPIAHEISILEPTTGQIINGSMVYISLNITDLSSFDYIDVFVNGQFITGLVGSINACYVPIFNNGTNTIYIEAYWLDGSTANDSVEINSINVIPIALPMVGDYIIWRYYSDYYNETHDFNFTFVEWLTPFEMNTSLIIHKYNDSGTIAIENYWLTVNILNGYIAESDMWWIFQHFYFFSGLNSSESTNSSVPFWLWNDVLNIIGETSWNGIDVWVLTNIYNDYEIYISKLSGLLVHCSDFYSLWNSSIIESSFLPDIYGPILIPHPNITYVEGTTGNNISWVAYDANPGIYVLYVNGQFEDQNSWSADNPIEINIDGLFVGTYNYTIIVFDQSSFNSKNTVFVFVIELVPPTVNSPQNITYIQGTTGHNISWIADDLYPDIYELYLDGQFDHWGYWSVGDPIIIYVDGLSAGIYNYTIIVFDQFGNYVSDIVYVTVLLDTTPPTLPSQDDITYNEGDTGYNITWTANDANPGAYIIYKDGVLAQQNTWSSGDPIIINVDGLSPGQYNYTIVVYDQSNNEAKDTVIVTVLDIVSPTVNSPSDITYSEGTTGNSIVWTASDAHPGTYVIYKDGVVVQQNTWTSDTPISIDIDGLFVGVYNYTIIVCDQSNNEVRDSVLVFVIDNVVPTVTSPQNISYIEGKTGYNITWIATDLHPGTYIIYKDGVVVEEGSWTSDVPIIINVDGLSAGTYNYTIVVFDESNNEVRDTVFVIVGKSSPGFELILSIISLLMLGAYLVKRRRIDD